MRALCAGLDAVFARRPDLREAYPRALAAAGRPSSEAITMVADRPGHDRRYAIDPTRAAAELGYHAAVSLEEGLDRTIGWYLDHAGWWKRVMDRDYDSWVREQYGRED